MAKDAYYFPHDSNARNDEKILAVRMKFGWEGYGLYWALIEKMRDSTDFTCAKDYNLIAFDLRTDASKIKSIIEDFRLFVFTDDGKYFYSDSLVNRMEEFERKRALRANAGRKGGNATAMLKQSSSNATASKVKESKVKESKVKEEISFPDRLNEKKPEPESFPKEVLDLTLEISKFLDLPDPEITLSLPFRELKCFVENIYRWGNFDFLKSQFKNYRLAKTDPKFRHGYKRFIGTFEQKYQDGAWCEKTWKTEKQAQRMQTKIKRFT